MDLIGQLFTGQPGTGDPDRVKSTERVENSVPGSVYNRVSEYRPTLTTRAHEIQIHNKAIRTISAGRKEINESQIQGLAIVSACLSLHGLNRWNITKIVDWSGAYRGWKLKVNQAIRQAIESDLLSRQGDTVSITEKGHNILNLYDQIYEEVRSTYERQGHERRQRQISKSKRARATAAEPLQYIERPED